MQTGEKEMKLSPRLTAIAKEISPGVVLADIGTDHAWIPVKLAMEKQILRAYACDIRRGPLLRAAEHIRACGVSNQVETRLCDGLSGLNPGEVNSVLIAGMGGELTVRILSDALKRKFFDGLSFRDSVKELILSPHTEHRAVRHFLRRENYGIVSEKMIEESGKFYLILKAIPGDAECSYRKSQEAGFDDEAAEYLGPLLLTKPSSSFCKYVHLLLRRTETARERLIAAEKKSHLRSHERAQELRATCERLQNILNRLRTEIHSEV